jgi:hypothetical protein
VSDHPSVKAQPSATPAPEVRHRAALRVADNVRRTGNDDLGTLLEALGLREETT